MENNNTEQCQPIENRNKICADSFRWVDAMYNQSNPNLYVIQHQTLDELFETIALSDDDCDQVMYLRRSVGANEVQSSFAYQLSEKLMGFSEQTGEPCDVLVSYLLDKQGNFHHALESDDDVIIALCGLYQQTRLTSFLMKGNPIPFLQTNVQTS